MPGQPSYFKINGEYSLLYPFPSKVQIGVELPQDIAPKNYTVNQLLHFEIDITKFPQALPEQIKKTKFYWKFGDGGVGEGLVNDHAYKQQGNYVVKILADDGTTSGVQLFESVLVRITPSKTNEIKVGSTFPYWYLISGVISIIFILFLVKYLTK